MSKPENKDVKSLKEKLSPLQYEVTQEEGTEPPFNNEYWDNRKEGIYVDVVSGEPLFASLHKYDSGTGWPSFFQPLEPKNIVEKEDKKLFATRIEVRSKGADSHLGHLFDDGPAPTRKRYCLNSAALTFIPKEDLAKKGYGQYLPLFDADSRKKAAAEQVAYFAGGCFWCVETDFLKVKGVKNVVSGYMGGDEKSPSYEQVSAGETGHAESVRVTFDSSVVSFDDLLKVFWLSIDPTAKDRQFCDVGKQYRSAVFYTDAAQKQAIDKSIAWLKQEFPSITPVTEISAAKTFYDAEEYHQRYAEKNPVRYKFYRSSCGRDASLKELFGKTREEILKRFSKER